MSSLSLFLFYDPPPVSTSALKKFDSKLGILMWSAGVLKTILWSERGVRLSRI